MKLKYESKQEIPEDLADSFVEFKEDDKTVYLHKDLADSRKEAYRYKGDLTALKDKNDDLSSKVQSLLDDAEKRKAEEEEKALQGKIDGGQHQEIIDDLKSKLEAKDLEWKQKYDDLKNSTLQEKKSAIVSSLTAKAVDGAEKQLSRLVSLDFSFDENGDIIVLDEAGKATSTTLEEYKSSLAERYPHLVAEVQPNGGMGKGSSGGAGGNKKPEDYTEAERVQLFKQNPEQFKQIFNTQ